jgi:alpha-galactosidase
MNRRGFLKTGMTASGLLLQPVRNGMAQSALRGAFVDILRPPDRIAARYAMTDVRPMTHSGVHWSSGKTLVMTEPRHTANGVQVAIEVEAEAGLTFLHLRWNEKTSERLLSLGDAWERSYGDLEWRFTTPDRPMPWYFLTTDGQTPAGYGLLTGPAAFCFWLRDAEGISLTIDLRNGGEAADLTGRLIHACTIVSIRGNAGEPIHAVGTRLCRLMCPKPRLPKEPIFGSNDWNYAYGKNTAEGILRDADLMATLAGSSSKYRPYAVIDDGYQDANRFPEMAALAQAIRQRDVKPGIWIRPLQARSGAKQSLLLPAARFGKRDEGPAFDPTIPEALAIVEEGVRKPVQWGYELIKHDFSTWELFGRWGFQMGPSITAPGWSFHDRSKTNAEIVGDLYRSIRKAAGERTVILGCNTVGHIAAGLFESQRITDDTSGREWERTRRYGVNGLAHRIAQHRTFFHADPDIVAITQKVPWEMTRQWLDVVARSGTSLFVAPDPSSMNEEARRAVQEAFALVQQSRGGHPEEPTTSLTPNAWQFESPRVKKSYDWVGNEGASAFLTF